MYPPDLNSVVTNWDLSYYVKWLLPPGDNTTAADKYYVCMYVWLYFLCKPTRTNVNTINAICPVYMFYFLRQTKDQSSSVTIVTDLPKAEWLMNRVLSPSAVTISLFSNASR